MSYTSKVALDTTDYDKALKDLLALQQRYNKEAERTDRIQHRITEGGSKNAASMAAQTTATRKQEEAVKQLAVAEQKLQRLKDRHASTLQIRGAGQYTKEIEEIKKYEATIVSLQNRITSLGARELPGVKTGRLHADLAKASAQLKEFHDRFAHFGSMPALDFSHIFKGMSDLGISPAIINRAKKGLEEAQRDLAAVWIRPEFQEQMRLDKVLGNADKYIGDFKRGYSDLVHSMRPYIAASEEARKTQGKINRLLEDELFLRRQLSDTRLSDATRKAIETRLNETGDQLEPQREKLARIAEHTVNKQLAADKEADRKRIATNLQSAKGVTASHIPYELDINKYKTATHEDRVRYAGLRSKHTQALSGFSAEEQDKAITDLTSIDAQTVSRAREKYAPIHEARRELSSFYEEMDRKDLAHTKQVEQEAYKVRETEYNAALAQHVITEDLKVQAARRAKEEEEKLHRERKDAWDAGQRESDKRDREIAENQARTIRERKEALLDHDVSRAMVHDGMPYGQKIAVQAEIDNLAGIYAKSNLPMEKYGHTLDEIKKGNVAVIRQHPELASGLRRVEVAAHDVDKTMHKMALTTGTIVRLTFARALTTAFYGMTNQMYEAWRVANEVNATIARIETISRQMPMATDAWRKSVRDLSIEYNSTQEDMATGMYDLVSNQVAEGPGAVDMAKIVAPFALTTGSSIADSVNLISSALNSFNLEGTKAEEIAAQLFSTIDLGRVTASDMANTYGRLGTFAKQANISMSEMNAMVARLTISGLSFERASTFIINVLNKLAKPGPDFQKFLGEIGANGSGEEAIAKFGLPGILQKIFDANQGSLEELGVMVKDIRAMIGYSGLLQDLPELQSAIDQISGSTLDNYNAATKTVMESSSFIVGKELKKMKAAWLDYMDTVIGAMAAYSKATDGFALGMFTPSALVSGGTNAALGLAPYMGAHAAVNRIMGGEKGDILGSMAQRFEAVDPGAKLSANKRMGKAFFSGQIAKQAAKTTKGGGLPGIGSVIGYSIPNVLLAAGAAYLTYELARAVQPGAAKAWDNFKNDTNDLTKGATKGFDDIIKKMRELSLITEKNTRAQIASITTYYADLVGEQEKALANQKNLLENSGDNSEKNLKTQQGALNGIEKFIGERNKSNMEYQIGMIRRPEGQMMARGGLLANRRNEIMYASGRNPELGAEMLQDWLGDIQSLRGNAMQYGQESPANRMKAGAFLDQIDMMSNEFIGGILQQLGIQPTGNVMEDTIAIRQATDVREKQLKETQEFRKSMEDRLDKGLDTWDRAVGFLQTLPESQQWIARQRYGLAPKNDEQRYYEAGLTWAQNKDNNKDPRVTEAWKAALDDANYRAKEATITPEGRLLDAVLQSATNVEELKKAGRIETIGASGANYQQAYDQQLASYFKEGGAFEDAATNLSTAITSLGSAEYRKQYTDLIAAITAWRDSMAQEGATTANRKQGGTIIRQWDALIGNASSDLSGSLYHTILPGVRTGLEGVRPEATKLAELGAFSGSEDPMMAQYLRPRTPEWTQANAMLAVNAARQGVSSDVMSQMLEVTTQGMAVSAGVVNLTTGGGGGQYKATGGGIGGPRGSDTVPAWLTPGEFVVNARSASRHQGLLNAINSPQYFDDGGQVMPLWWRRKHGMGGNNPYAMQGSSYNPQIQAALRAQRSTEMDAWGGGSGGGRNSMAFNQWRQDRIDSQPQAASSIDWDAWKQYPRRMRAEAWQSFASNFNAGKKHGNSMAFNQWRQDKIDSHPQAASSIDWDAWKQYPRRMRAEAWQSFAENWNKPRAYNVRPRGNYLAQGGGAVTNSTTVNANINLSSTGSNSRDARQIVNEIKREAHRGGLSLRNIQ